jgi:hypothetical protein
MASHRVSTHRQDGNRTSWFTWRCTCGRSGGGNRFQTAAKALNAARNNGHR